MIDNKTKLITGADIQKIILELGLDSVMDLLIESLEKEIKGLNESTVIPVRSGFNYTYPQPGLIEWMPIHSVNSEVIVKIVGYHPNNPSLFQLPTILSSITAYDTRTGHLIGVMDGVLPTALRTGAASALASKFAAHPSSTTLGLIGCGTQAITQLHAISRLFDIDVVLYHDVDKASQASFSNRVKDLNLNIELVSSSLNDTLQNADIICTATSINVGEGPLFTDIALKNNVHINAVGSDFPGKVELPHELVVNAFIFPDFLEQALIEGECQQLKKHQIDSDFQTIVQEFENDNSLHEIRTIFDSTGWSLEDKVVFDMFMELSHDLGFGNEIELEFIPPDAKNPYHFIKTSVPSV